MAKKSLGSSAKRMSVAERLHREWQEREAARTPEQRAREKERHEAIDRMIKPQMDAACALARASGLYPELFALYDELHRVEERPFDEHLTDAGRISAKGLGIRLD